MTKTEKVEHETGDHMEANIPESDDDGLKGVCTPAGFCARKGQGAAMPGKQSPKEKLSGERKVHGKPRKEGCEESQKRDTKIQARPKFHGLSPRLQLSGLFGEFGGRRLACYLPSPCVAGCENLPQTV